jgi:hypothetical protein
MEMLRERQLPGKSAVEREELLRSMSMKLLKVSKERFGSVATLSIALLIK